MIQSSYFRDNAGAVIRDQRNLPDRSKSQNKTKPNQIRASREANTLTKKMKDTRLMDKCMDTRN